jgi:hypothetical protein
MRNTIIPTIILLLWLSIGLYFGIGGLSRAKLDETLEKLEEDKIELTKNKINVSYDGLTFETKYELNYYLEAESIETSFPWATRISSFMGLIFTSFSFGLIGSLISIIKEVVFQNLEINRTKYISYPLLGILTGLVVLGLSYLLPTILIENQNQLRPITLMFLSLFAGMFCEKFYEKLSVYFNNIFP